MSNYNYHTFNSGTYCGSMICNKCNKKIEQEKEEWVSYQKSNKFNDWKYITIHRGCFKDQSGWLKIEREKKEFDLNVKRALECIKSFKKSDGEFEDYFLEALIKEELIEE